MTRPWPAIVVLALACVVAACQSNGLVATATSTAPNASAFLEPPTRAELEAIRFRTSFGLQADLEYVRAVAVNPAATSRDFGVPLLPAEAAEMAARAANRDAVVGIIVTEGEAHPGDYCGTYIDNEHGGTVTSMWKSGLQGHQAAILFKVGPAARVAFLGCRFSETELTAVKEAISAGWDWMLELPARARSVGINTIANRIDMQISSAVPDAADRVLAHYVELFHLQPGMLFVTSDGTGAALRPWGTLRLFVVGPDGKPVGSNDLGLNWVSQDLPGLACGFGDVGIGVSGTAEPTDLPCQEGLWLVQVYDRGVDDVIGTGTVQVRAGVAVNLRIQVTRDPPPGQ